MFQAIIEDREAPAVEKNIDGYTGFLFYDKEGKAACMGLKGQGWDITDSM